MAKLNAKRRNALVRASQNAGPALKAKIKAKVHRKFPGISIGKMDGGAVKHRADRAPRQH